MRAISSLDSADAELAVQAMRLELSERKKSAVLAVADVHGDLLALFRSDGAPASSITIARNKAWTSAREGVPTIDIGKRLRHADEAFDISYYGDERYCGWGGGVPVIVGQVCVGSVAVSGLPEQEDHAIAQVGARAIVTRG